jgi:hypothetical protein
VQLREISNNTALIASTGGPDGNTVPTQFAVKTFVENKFLQDVTVTAGLPLTITDTSSQDGQGYWTRTRRLELAVNTANGLARLNGSGLIPSSLLPSYVDDVLEFANLAGFPATGESGKIYVALDTNKTYRWSGSAYIEIASSPGSGSSQQLAALGLNVAPVSGFELTLGGSTCQLVTTVTAASGVYTLDVTAANEFVTAAAIAGATTINLSNLASLPNGYRWRGVLSFAYTSGVVSFFTGNTGYTVKWDGGTAPTLTASDLETVVITVRGGVSVIEVTAQQGRA